METKKEAKEVKEVKPNYWKVVHAEAKRLHQTPEYLGVDYKQVLAVAKERESANRKLLLLQEIQQLLLPLAAKVEYVNIRNFLIQTSTAILQGFGYTVTAPVAVVAVEAPVVKPVEAPVEAPVVAPVPEKPFTQTQLFVDGKPVGLINNAVEDIKIVDKDLLKKEEGEEDYTGSDLLYKIANTKWNWKIYGSSGDIRTIYLEEVAWKIDLQTVAILKKVMEIGDKYGESYPKILKAFTGDLGYTIHKQTLELTKDKKVRSFLITTNKNLDGSFKNAKISQRDTFFRGIEKVASSMVRNSTFCLAK